MSNPSFHVPWWRSFVFWYVMMFTISTLCLLIATIVWFHYEQYASTEDRFGFDLELVAKNSAPDIDGDLIYDIKINEHAALPQFETIRQKLRGIKNRNRLEDDNVYILRSVDPKKNSFEFVVMLQDKTFIGSTYTPPSHVVKTYQRALSGMPGRTNLYHDKNGSFISGLAPIYDSSRQVVALLQVDYGIGHFLQEITDQTQNLIMLALFLTLLGISFGIVMHHRLKRRVFQLLEGTEAIKQERYDHQVPTLGKDEIGVLAGALNAVMAKLRERFEMLKFIPKHTLNMMNQPPKAKVCRIKNAAVWMSSFSNQTFVISLGTRLNVAPKRSSQC